jgi:hypothetical protein
MAHEGAAPGTPGRVHAPPEGGLPGGLGDQRNVVRPVDPSGFVASDSIFGWSWLGQWAENSANAPTEVTAFLKIWVDKFNKAAEAELSGDTPGTQTAVVIQQFRTALNSEGWWKDKTALWQSVQKLRYGLATPGGEYAAVVQSYRDHIADAARSLGFVDTNGNLTFDINGAKITELIEGTNGLMLNAGTVVGGLPTPDPVAANRMIEEHLIGGREFDVSDGAFGYEGAQLGPGALLDTYNWIKSLASDNFITLGDEEIWDMVSKFKREEMSPQSVWERIAGQVGDQYDFLNGTGIMNRINQFSSSEEAGWGGASSIKNHLAPVRTAVANTWGLGKDEINLGDVFGSGLEDLTISNEDGSQRFMNSREAKQWARQQPQYKETAAYKTGMSNIAQSMLQSFGVR